jgi:hypothetical protein
MQRGMPLLKQIVVEEDPEDHYHGVESPKYIIQSHDRQSEVFRRSARMGAVAFFEERDAGKNGQVCSKVQSGVPPPQ